MISVVYEPYTNKVQFKDCFGSGREYVVNEPQIPTIL